MGEDSDDESANGHDFDAEQAASLFSVFNVDFADPDPAKAVGSSPSRVDFTGAANGGTPSRPGSAETAASAGSGSQSSRRSSISGTTSGTQSTRASRAEVRRKKKAQIKSLTRKFDLTSAPKRVAAEELRGKLEACETNMRALELARHAQQERDDPRHSDHPSHEDDAAIFGEQQQQQAPSRAHDQTGTTTVSARDALFTALAAPQPPQGAQRSRANAAPHRTMRAASATSRARQRGAPFLCVRVSFKN